MKTSSRCSMFCRAIRRMNILMFIALLTIWFCILNSTLNGECLCCKTCCHRWNLECLTKSKSKTEGWLRFYYVFPKWIKVYFVNFEVSLCIFLWTCSLSFNFHKTFNKTFKHNMAIELSLLSLKLVEKGNLNALPKCLYSVNSY